MSLGCRRLIAWTEGGIKSMNVGKPSVATTWTPVAARMWVSYEITGGGVESQVIDAHTGLKALKSFLFYLCG